MDSCFRSLSHACLSILTNINLPGFASAALLTLRGFFSKQNFDTLSSSSSRHSSNYLLNQIEPSKSTRHLSTQNFDTKPSDAIEQLQMLLQTRSKESSHHTSHDISRRTSSKSASTLPRHAGNGSSSSSTASDKTRQEKFNHTHHDLGQLLRMAQRLHN